MATPIAGGLSMALLAIAGYAMSIGWIGMRTWALQASARTGMALQVNLARP